MSEKPLCIGLISDTHGLLRPQAVEALRGCDLVLHAGDIGDADILKRLSELAPVKAVRGNNDTGAWASVIPEAVRFQVGGRTILMLHDVKMRSPLDMEGKVHVVVSGHSHRPTIEWREQVLFLNPGSAGPRRFKLPVTVATLTITDGRIQPRLIELSV